MEINFIWTRRRKKVILNYNFSLINSFQLGIAVGFVLPPILVKNHADKDLIGRDLQFMFYSVAGFTTILVVLVIFCESQQISFPFLIQFIHLFPVFKRAPPTPPSNSAALAEQPKPNQSSPFLHSIKNLCCNVNYVLLLLSYGMNGECKSDESEKK